MSQRHIVPVLPASGDGDTVLIEVQKDGTHDLDLRLVGCEGESPYVASIKQRNLSKLKQKFKGSDDEWATILSHFLLQQQPEPEHVSLLHGIRLVYTLKDDSLELSIRQDVQGIKVTLGEIILPRDEEFEFNPFEWAQVSAQAHTQALQQMAKLQTRVKEEQDALAKLNAQLEDFLKSKSEAESAMLQQFMILLNEKKSKIRDQNRLLAEAQVDATTASEIQTSRSRSKSHKPSTSRPSKRKATTNAADTVADTASDSDQMEIDQSKAEEEEDDNSPEPVTPDQSGDETEEEETEPAPTTRQRTGTARASRNEADEGDLPQPRSLPLGRPSTRSKDVEKAPSSKHKQANDDDEDDETEDEL